MNSTISSLPYRCHTLEESDEWLSELEDKGYTVVNVASEGEVEKARDLLWNWLSDLGTGIKRSDPSSWTDDAWPDWPGYKKYGNCKSEGGAHQEAAWFIRGLPKLKKVFQNIYKTEDLIVSMDGIIVWRSWRSWKEDEARTPTSSRLHMDQNPFTKPGFQCVQGMLPLYPVTPEIGGTLVVPGSHRHQEKFRTKYPDWSSHERDFCALNDDDSLYGSERLVPLQPGDILLWDSRLVHCGRVGDGDPEELARASLCVCMGPRDRASSEVLQKRREALKEGWSFSHWPWEARYMNGQVSVTSRYQQPTLTQDQWRLV